METDEVMEGTEDKDEAETRKYMKDKAQERKQVKNERMEKAKNLAETEMELKKDLARAATTMEAMAEQQMKMQAMIYKLSLVLGAATTTGTFSYSGLGLTIIAGKT